MIPIKQQPILRAMGKSRDTERDVTSNRLIVSGQDCIHFLRLEQIAYLRAESNYTRIVLNDQTELLSTRTLKAYECMLTDHGFLRVHASYLVNLAQLAAIRRNGHYTIILGSGTTEAVSKSDITMRHQIIDQKIYAPLLVGDRKNAFKTRMHRNMEQKMGKVSKKPLVLYADFGGYFSLNIVNNSIIDHFMT